MYLSPPHMGGKEETYVKEVFNTNWIAPVGPQLTSFEKKFAEKVGSSYAVALSSGTAALHLALRYAGVNPGDEVMCSAFTFIASVSPVTYLGAKPVFIDSEHATWNLDPELIRRAFRIKAEKNQLPKALIAVHLYGQSAALDTILEICNEYGVFLIEDAAESLGATYKGRQTGTFGQSGVFSFNGNKIITTSGGGMLVTEDEQMAEKIRFWATQAKEAVAHYEHKEIGYNYRLSNVSAAIGLGQLEVLDERIRRKREIFNNYKKMLGDLPGISFMPEPKGHVSTRWLTCIIVDPEKCGCTNLDIMERLESENIESRPLWKPMHLQPVFQGFEIFGGKVSSQLYQNGLCLPSGTLYPESDYERIGALIHDCCHR